MNLQNSHSKKYVLTFFMSTCLLASSFLSTSARASLLTAMKTKAIEWRQTKEPFNSLKAATTLGLTITSTKIVQDIKTKTGRQILFSKTFTPEDLKKTDTKEQRAARSQNAKLVIFQKLIEQSNLEKTIENQIKDNSFLEFKQHTPGYFNTKDSAYNYYSSKPELTALLEKAAQQLNIGFNFQDLKDHDQKTRQKAKDKLVILEEYIKMVNYASLDKQKAEWVEQKYTPKKEDVQKFSFLTQGEITHILRDITAKIDLLQKDANSNTEQNKHKALFSGIRSIGKHKSQQNSDNSTTPSRTVKFLTEMINNNSAQESEDSASTSSKPTIETGRAEQKNKPQGFNFKQLFARIKKSEPIKDATSVQNLSKAIDQEEHIQSFKNSMEEKNYFAALNNAKDRNLGSAYTQEATNGIVSNLDSNTIKSILFVNANSTSTSNKFDFSSSIKDKPVVKEILSNIFERQQQNDFITELSKYANENLVSLISKNNLQGQAALDVTKLAAIVDKAPIEKLLNAQLEIKNILRINNVQDSGIKNLSNQVSDLISLKLQKLDIIPGKLTREQVISLIKNWNRKALDGNITILISDTALLKKEIDKEFKLTTQNSSNTNTNRQQGSLPTPPPPFGNVPPPPVSLTNNTNSGIDLDKFKASYPDLYSLYNYWSKHNQQKPKTTTNNTTTTTAGDSQIEYGPITEHAQLYKDYRENANNKSDQLITESLRQKESVINTIRQIVMASHATKGSDIEALITLFDNQDPKIQEEAMKVFNAFKEDQDLDLKNVTKSMSTQYVKDKLFGEDKDEAIKRILYPSSQISELQKAEIQEYANKLEYTTQLNKITDPLAKLRFAYNNNTLNTHVSELINTANTLPYKEQMRVLAFLNKNSDSLEEQDKKLKKAISISERQNIKNSVLSVLEIKDLVQDQQLNARSLLFTIKDKDPELLKTLLEAKIIWEENKGNNLPFSNELHTKLTNLLSLNNDLSKNNLERFLNKITIAGIEAAFKESLTAANTTTIPPHQHTGSVPPPPPPPPLLDGGNVPPPPPMFGFGFTNNTSASSIFTQMNIEPQLIAKIEQLPKSKIKAIKTPQTNNNEPTFSSPIAQKCYDALTKHDPSKIGLSNEEKLKHTILEEVLTQYLNSIDNKRANILKELDKNEKVTQEVLASLKPGFVGPKTEIADTLYKLDHQNPKALAEAFNTAYKLDNPNFKELTEAFVIDPKTELGKVIYALHAGQYLTLLNDPEFMKLTDEESVLKNVDKQALKALVVELEAKQAELEEVTNIYNQSEDSNNKDLIKKVTAILKLASKDHDSDKEELLPDNTTTSECTEKDESSNKTDESDDKELSALSSIHEQAIDASDNKKSLLVLRSSDEDDKGYETDEELEESNSTTDEESKKDIVLESEDEAIDMSPKTEEIIEQDEAAQRQQVSDDTGRKVAILVKATSTLHKPIHYHILSDRLKVAAIGAGDEEASINRGLWISGLYGINKQGAWKNITKYQSRTTGITIGADAEFINSHDVIGIAYSRLESQIKYNKKLGTTAVNGHLLSIYGLKELIKGFSLQAITSYGHNYINNKSKSINNIIGKYQNNYLSFESLLNYKYRTKYDLHFIPNIGFKYDYSRASNYKEYNVDIENLMIQKKSNQLFESSLGGKIVFKPIATTSNIVLTPSLYGNIERHFNNKNTKVNAKATFKGQILQETIIIPKQPKLGYNIGSNILVSRKNINVLFEYNYYTHKKYQSHQGLIKLKVNL